MNVQHGMDTVTFSMSGDICQATLTDESGTVIDIWLGSKASVQHAIYNDLFLFVDLDTLEN
jgi:hypothetical protein